MTSRVVHGLNLLLVLALLGGSAAAWPWLPAEIPIHFDASGEPDRWADTTVLSWFGLPVLAFLLAAGMYLIGVVVPRRPEWLSVPNRKRFLALTEEARAPVYRRIRTVLHLGVTFVLVIFGLLQLAVYREAHGDLGSGYVVAVLVVAVAGSPLLSVFAIVGLQQALDRAGREGRGEGREGSGST
ncbi:MAG TPA: DUF1648 domain-containing protein [Longimicrobiales bacterium]|nr:DUF1648 domain-containing protein [Longimicrobiales bacterium]